MKGGPSDNDGLLIKITSHGEAGKAAEGVETGSCNGFSSLGRSKPQRLGSICLESLLC